MTPQEKFWKWFAEHEEQLCHFEGDRERVFELLTVALHKVDKYLTFEIGPEGEKREFVISAGGISEAFPAVVSLLKSAPNLDRWRVTAFRPRRVPLNTIEFRGKSADPGCVQFSLLENGKIAGIRLFIPEFEQENSDWRQIGYLLLDDALGEYDVETRLGLIKMYSPDVPTAEKRYPFHELPVLFDRLVSRLEGRSGEPS